MQIAGHLHRAVAGHSFLWIILHLYVPGTIKVKATHAITSVSKNILYFFIEICYFWDGLLGWPLRTAHQQVSHADWDAGHIFPIVRFPSHLDSAGLSGSWLSAQPLVDRPNSAVVRPATV